MFRLNIALALVTLTLALGCGGSDSGSNAQAVCNDIAEGTCDRAYDCLSSEELTALGLPATKAACASMYKQTLGCDSADADDLCEGNEIFQTDEADSCLEQLESASCNQIRDSDNFAPACDRVCSVE